VQETITFLEMTDPGRLRPGRPAPAVVLDGADHGTPLARSTLVRVGTPHHWPCASWSEAAWAERFARPHLRYWTVRQAGEVAGAVELEAQPGGEVEIMSFGLVPEFVGRGIGGHALTLAIEQAWRLPPLGGPAVRRVWLHTSSLDHPNALPNYLSRGLTPFRTETWDRDDLG
jgi:RimJ/RimL family protein N-acetyltransferase